MNTSRMHQIWLQRSDTLLPDAIKDHTPTDLTLIYTRLRLRLASAPHDGIAIEEGLGLA
jgi:hypothetical protein